MHLVRWLIGLCGVALLLPSARAQDEARPPNILLIVADDLGWNDVGYHGALIRTPHLDRLAASGVELDQHYVQPVCSPTRAALLSGRYPSRFGPHVCSPTNRRAFPAGTETLASALKSRGYDTAIAGKWHLGSRVEWGPHHYGFDRSYGCLTGVADPWTHQYRKGTYQKTWHRNQEFIEEEGNATELIAQEVLGWIRAKREPWFIYVPFTAVHIPIDAPDEYEKPYESVDFDDDSVRNASLRRYAAFVSQLDAKIGEFVRALEATGQRQQTLIVFTSDNGGLPGGGNAYVSDVPPAPAAGSNKPLRGRKGQLFEGGIRVPALVSWPGRLSARVVRAPIHAVDWMPTLTKLVGYRPEQDLQWDGGDIWPLLSGEDQEPPPRTLYWPYRKQRAIRHGDWKLIVREGKPPLLFDLARDPYEKTNRAAQEPDRIEDLRARLAALRTADLQKVPEDLARVPER